MVIRYLLQRFKSDDDYTIGAIFREHDAGRLFKCFTLEDEYRDVKVAGETRVPKGDYPIKLRTVGNLNDRYQQKYEFHQGMLWLQDVPGFEWIYIHVGNTDDNTDGCILVGMGADASSGTISKSVIAYSELYEEMVTHLQQGNDVLLKVRDYA